MKRCLIASLVVSLIVSGSSLIASCRVQRVRNVHQQHVEAKIAVPVAVPVAVVSPYFYGYSQFAPDTRSHAPIDTRSHVPAWERTDKTLRVDELETDSAPADLRRRASPQAFPRGAWERGTSLVSQHCVTCHGGGSPQGGLSLDRAERLSLADRLQAIRAVLSRRMPKGAKLDDEQLRGVVEELSDIENE